MTRIGLIFTALTALVAFTSAAHTQSVEPNTDRPGMDYRSFDLAQPDPLICQQQCLSEPVCQAWTYVRPGVQGPQARCWLKNAVPAPRMSDCCTSGMRQAATRIFNYPTIQGMRVDRCLTWATNCDEPAASAFCRSQGMSAAVSWAWEYVSPTYVQGSGQVCQGGGCGGFSQITCR